MDFVPEEVREALHKMAHTAPYKDPMNGDPPKEDSFWLYPTFVQLRQLLEENEELRTLLDDLRAGNPAYGDLLTENSILRNELSVAREHIEALKTEINKLTAKYENQPINTMDDYQTVAAELSPAAVDAGYTYIYFTNPNTGKGFSLAPFEGFE